MKTDVFLILCSMLPAISLAGHEALRKVLHNYETLHSSDIYTHHHVSKRRADNQRLYHDKIVSFKTLGRNFTLHLTSNFHLFTKDFSARSVHQGVSGSLYEDIPLETEQFYTGYIADDGKSKVTAYWEDGNLMARIATSGETYIVEPSWRQLGKTGKAGMLAYRASDMKTEAERDPEHHVSPRTCGWVKADGVDESIGYRNPVLDDNLLDGVTHVHDSLYHGKKRYKRQSGSNKVCHVALVADYRFTKNVGDNSISTTAKYLAGILGSINAIYEATDFGGGYAGTGFTIRSIIVHQDPSPTPEYNKDAAYWETQPFLESFGKEDWSAFCLAHLFTYQKFDGGVQGLGWIAAASSNEVGGICSPKYGSKWYNTAWTSHLNSYDSRILSQEANLVTAHEFGHNWGSPHDSANCAPSVQNGGKHLMYQYSVSGYDPNNDVFSSCSKSSIGSVLSSKGSGCFVERNAAYCGNYDVEGDEQCDAGSAGALGLDSCCTSQCQLLKNVQCSDANSPCCKDCQYRATSFTCRSESRRTCQAETKCSGTSGDCPVASPLPQGSTCSDRGSCDANGQCIPLCEYNGLISCSCDSDDVSACKYCCKSSDSATCEPYQDGSGTTFQLDEGRTCYQGICVADKCEITTVDNTARLWDVIKNFNINTILKWMKDNVVIATIVASLIFYLPMCLVVFIIDRRIAKKEKDELDWHDKDNDRLVRDGETRNIRRAQPRRRRPGAYSRLEESDASVSNVDYRPGPL